MTRISEQQDIVKLLSGFEAFFEEIKNKQITGANSTQPSLIHTGATWDIDQTVSSAIEKIVELSPSDVSGDATAAGYYLKARVVGGGSVLIERMRLSDYKSQKWRCTITGFGENVKVKFFLKANGSGTLKVL